MNNPSYLLTFVVALGSGLVGGIFFAFSNFVMKALARVPPAQGIAAMQSINVVVLNKWFFAVFFGSAVCCLALAITSIVLWQRPGAGYLLIGSLLYLVSTILVTILCNVPLNDALSRPLIRRVSMLNEFGRIISRIGPLGTMCGPSRRWRQQRHLPLHFVGSVHHSVLDNLKHRHDRPTRRHPKNPKINNCYSDSTQLVLSSKMTKTSIRFKTKLFRPAESTKVNSWTFLVLPKNASAKLPSRGMTAIEGTINGVPFQAVLEPDGQKSHWLKVDRKLGEAAGADAGDVVTLEIAPAAKEPEPEVPADLKKALGAAAPKTKKLWSDITPIARRDWIHWITSAKQAETRARRIKNACSMLAGGKRRVCCFDRSGFYDKSLSAPKAAT